MPDVRATVGGGGGGGGGYWDLQGSAGASGLAGVCLQLDREAGDSPRVIER